MQGSIHPTACGRSSSRMGVVDPQVFIVSPPSSGWQAGLESIYPTVQDGPVSSPSSSALELEKRETRMEPSGPVSQDDALPVWMLVAFGASGFAALTYQIVWQ